MRAAWYESRGPAREVLRTGELPIPEPGPEELRLRVECSGINPGDVKKRQGWQDAPMEFPRIVPHNDGAGVVEAVGPGVERSWTGRRVWCSYAQSYRPHGTAAAYTVVPLACVGPLPDGVPPEQGACLGIPGITAHRAVFADGPVAGRTVVVAGALGGVGRAALVLARRGGARVIGTVTRAEHLDRVRDLGAQHALVTGPDLADAVLELSRGHGADRVVETAFDANIRADARLLAPGGTLATYATGAPEPVLPFWPLAFRNATVRFLGYDDFPREAVRAGIAAVTAAASAGDLRYPVASVFPLGDIAAAHEAVERGSGGGRVVVGVG
ncbi:NADPH:quinone reductase [Streptomyces sp. NPDC003077]|uniref:NADPH:quinone reductase n=1 Tax=Streptomyces sp. NPDC003077 TaxID=3154443 RepID=UPI0033A95968